MKNEVVKKNIIIDIPFNIDLSPYMMPKSYIHPKLRRSFRQAQTEEWITKRLALFMKYTANSLIHQSNQDYLCVLRCTSGTQLVIEEQLQQYPVLPGNIFFTDNAQEIIDKSMKENGSLYHVVIDSDNMYHKDFISKLQRFEPQPQTKTIICQEGYVLDIETGQLASIFHESPSFYAALYDEETYKELYQERLFERHWHAINYPYEIMDGRNYCICTHSLNVDNAFYKFNDKYKRHMIEGKDKGLFLAEWHLDS